MSRGLSTLSLVAIACFAASAHLEHLPTLGIGTSEVTRGGRAASARERRTPAGAGFEQSWRFEARPQGAGPLEVRVDVALPFLGADADGLHFRDVRYGHATWIDAAGVRTGVESRFDRGAIRLTVPEEVVNASQFPAVLDPLVGPELSFGPALRMRPGHYDYEPIVGFNGVDYFVAWIDFRRFRQCDIFASRVGLDGGVFDPALQLVPWSEWDCPTPSDAEFDGTNLMLGFELEGDATIARVTPQAINLDPLTRRLSPGGFPRLARSPAQMMMLYERRGGTTQLHTLRIAPDGGVTGLDAGPVVADTLAPIYSGPGRVKDIAFDGARYLIVWVDGRTDIGDVYGMFLDANGNPAAAQFPIATGAGAQVRCTVTFGGGNYLVAWEDMALGGGNIRGAIVLPSGALQPAFDIGSVAAAERRPAVTWDGVQFVVAWEVEGPDSIRAARVTPTGIVLDTNGVAVETNNLDVDNGRVAIASEGGGRSLVVFLSQGLHVAAKRLVGATPLEPSALSFSTVGEQQVQATMASNARGQTVMTWSASSNGISGAILAVDGGAPLPLVIETGDDTRYGANVASDGNLFWVAWSGDYNFRGRLVAADGTLWPTVDLTTVPFQSYGGATTRDGTGFINVWSDARTSPAGVRARRSFVDGGLGPEFEVSPGGPTDKNGAVVATNGAGVSLVVWEHNNGQVRATRVQGTVSLDVPALTLPADRYFSRPSVTSDGLDFLVVWEVTGNDVDLRGTFIPGAGSYGGGTFLVAGTAVVEEQPVARWDGRELIVAYETTDDFRRDVWAAVIQRDGGAQPRFKVAATPGETDILPALSPVSPGNWWFGYSRFDPAPLVSAQRVHARFFQDERPGAPCSTAGTCASGFCVAGVCCASACGGACEQCSTGSCLPHAATTVCRAAAGVCDPAESCDGTSGSCPANLFAPTGAPCSDGMCSAGLCVWADGGTLADGGSLPDAGATADAGQAPDGGPLPGDAGTLADGGTQGPAAFSVGCGCGAPGGPPLLVLLMLALWRSRRQ